MRRFQRVLAVPMALSALAALWLLYRQAGNSGLLFGVAGAVGLALLLFGAGQRQRIGKRILWAPLAALAMAALLFVVMPPRSSAEARGQHADSAWSEGEVGSDLSAGHPVFVYFTADWCLTCKANEAGAIDRAEVRDVFKKAGVKVLVGDWTNGDPAITRFLESRGRAGVPYYLWYRPGNPPEELPQILTPSMLTSRARSATP